MERLGLGGREMTVSGHSKNLVLKVVQPSLVGLMDGSVSTLAPLFATAFATGDSRVTFLVGLAGRLERRSAWATPRGFRTMGRSPDGGIRSRAGRSRASRPSSAVSYTPYPSFSHKQAWHSTWPSGWSVSSCSLSH